MPWEPESPLGKPPEKGGGAGGGLRGGRGVDATSTGGGGKGQLLRRHPRVLGTSESASNQGPQDSPVSESRGCPHPAWGGSMAQCSCRQKSWRSSTWI